MFRILADENLDGRIVRGLLLRVPGADVARVQDEGLLGASDPAILEWAAMHGRVVVTHDVRTMTHHGAQRVGAGQAMPGLVLVSKHLPVGSVIDDLALLIEGSEPADLRDQILYLPL